MRIKEKRKKKGGCFEVAMNVPEETKQKNKQKKSPKPKRWILRKMLQKKDFPCFPLCVLKAEVVPTQTTRACQLANPAAFHYRD